MHRLVEENVSDTALVYIVNNIDRGLALLSIAASILAIIVGYGKIRRAFSYRHVKRVLGLKDGDRVLLVCSELPDPEIRQMVEPREFIYLMKYGDLDAWVELLFSLLRIYPNIDLRVMSSGEALASRVDLECQIFMIGGPDYNLLVRRIHDMDVVRIKYDLKANSLGQDDEIVLSDVVTDTSYWFQTLDKDYGYIERIRNPFSDRHDILFFGGCHTVGVTSAVKFLSAFGEGRRGISEKTLTNARILARAVGGRRQPFTLLVSSSKVGSSIAAPTAAEANLFLGQEPTGRTLGR